MSADRRPSRRIAFTRRGRAEFDGAGVSVKSAVEGLLERPRDQIDAEPLLNFPNWFIARVGYLDVMFRWLTAEEVLELYEDDDPPAQVALVQRVARLPYRKRAFGIPVAAAAAGAGLGLWLAPDHMDRAIHRAGFGGFFGTMAQVIATLFVALAIEARHLELRNRFGLVTVGYVATGLAASVAASSPSVPASLYRGLLAVALAGGLGALASVLLVARGGLQHRDPEAEPPEPPQGSAT